MARSYLTTREVAERLGAPQWLVRRVVDSLSADIPRAGQYRLVPAELLPRIKAALLARGRQSVAEVAHAD